MEKSGYGRPITPPTPFEEKNQDQKVGENQSGDESQTSFVEEKDLAQKAEGNKSWDQINTPFEEEEKDPVQRGGGSPSKRGREDR